VKAITKPRIYTAIRNRCRRCRRRLNYKPVNGLCQPCREYLKSKGLILQNTKPVLQPNGNQFHIKKHHLANRIIRFKCKCRLLITAKVLANTVRCYNCGYLYNITLIAAMGRLMARVSVHNPNISFPSLANQTIGIYEVTGK